MIYNLGLTEAELLNCIEQALKQIRPHLGKYDFSIDKINAMEFTIPTGVSPYYKRRLSEIRARFFVTLYHSCTGYGIYPEQAPEAFVISELLMSEWEEADFSFKRDLASTTSKALHLLRQFNDEFQNKKHSAMVKLFVMRRRQCVNYKAIGHMLTYGEIIQWCSRNKYRPIREVEMNAAAESLIMEGVPLHKLASRLGKQLDLSPAYVRRLLSKDDLRLAKGSLARFTI